MLREHFRCVPPIIAYSNRVFYKGADSAASHSEERPSASTRRWWTSTCLEAGATSTTATTKKRRLIAQEIEALLADEKFARPHPRRRVLLGMEQAKHHRRRCVVTLQTPLSSCVGASSAATRARSRAASATSCSCRWSSTRRTARRCPGTCSSSASTSPRAGRATGCTWCGRYDPSDLSDKDLRMTLLTHFDKPYRHRQGRDREPPRPVRVGIRAAGLSALRRAGYRVVPQVKTGAYRIDMVVEGAGRHCASPSNATATSSTARPLAARHEPPAGPGARRLDVLALLRVDLGSAQGRGARRAPGPADCDGNCPSGRN